MSWKVICLIVLLISVSLSACSTTTGETQAGSTAAPAGIRDTSRDFKMPQDSTMIRKMDGQAMVKQGETMTQQGQAMVEKDKARMKEGQTMIQKGQTMIQKGQTMIEESTATQS